MLAGDRTLKIDPRHVTGFQDMQSEITSMLEILDYEQLSLRDPSTGRPVYVADQHGQYRMLFRAADTAPPTKNHKQGWFVSPGTHTGAISLFLLVPAQTWIISREPSQPHREPAVRLAGRTYSNERRPA